MEPQSGHWTGNFIATSGKSFDVSAKFQFHDGKAEGTFEVLTAGWTGPSPDTITSGGYSEADGRIHFEFAGNEKGDAQFKGRYEALDAKTGFIVGRVDIQKGGKSEIGILTLRFSPTLAEIGSGGVWGG